MAVTHPRRPLPGLYYYFFWLIEPALTLAGAWSAISNSQGYAADLLHNEEPGTVNLGKTIRGQIVVGGLGSCFLLFAMISLSLFPIIKRSLPDRPDIQERLVKGILIPLAIADLTHISMTLLPLPMSLLQQPLKWTYMIHCNVMITAFLFLVRSMYLLGVGRGKSAKRASRKDL
ncbi:hypothetical protein BD324DRAFT_639238 [Kockovaella imperatae]|uniref:DUF7704 domain-containing protein n=1 Tax=Kockovaella imperatae TaxID=4999 RepID=A0A1Y1U8V7_9TREE|nr:hypothetical protein BD324DRAFT_639238 [Kockovaella imperatae]ORX33545.1 hypothetical protein BD324DRAFT_639238 [Kockovaella imperatae]